MKDSGSFPKANGRDRSSFSPKNDSLYVRTGDSLGRIDINNDLVNDSLVFSNFGYGRKFSLQPDGNLILSDKNKVMFLDGEMNKNREVDIGFQAGIIIQGQNGKTFCFEGTHNGRIAAIDREGNVTCPGREYHNGSLVQAENGFIPRRQVKRQSFDFQGPAGCL